MSDTTADTATAPDPSTIGLPKDFLFGTSTASYQIEGAVDEDGRGRTVWDDFTAKPGTIKDGSSGAVADDHYHRVPEDVALLKQLGVDAYRFSIAWSRILPEGRGTVNQKGLDFYDRLIDQLLEAGIQPAATLFHWDSPSAFEPTGGWLDREITEHFAAYAQIVGERFADRVAHWMPINEPFVYTVLGHGIGVHAPGKTLGTDCLPVAHHLMLGHGLACQALRAAGATSIGTANNHTPMWPASDDPADVAAAALYGDLHNNLFADSMLLGTYPESMLPYLPVRDGDMETIRQPLDFYGMNYYWPTLVTRGDGSHPESPGLPFGTAEITGVPKTDFNWPVVPEGLSEMLGALAARYPNLPPVFITENGASYAVGPDAEGRVRDTARVEFIDQHLRALVASRAQGVDVRGYFCWSLLDNFEWAEGYTQRFGITWVDYETLERTPKDSYWYYRDVIAATKR